MNQQCKVCGEPAAGFHFGAFTCEGCKSFFGRSYNNLSSIGECKNNGECVINKKNRTACKACRLRKCLMVGMSKSGSRYGRRSNWFKIHCLLQEQQQQATAAGSAGIAGLFRPHPYLPFFNLPPPNTDLESDSASSVDPDDDSRFYHSSKKISSDECFVRRKIPTPVSLPSVPSLPLGLPDPSTWRDLFIKAAPSPVQEQPIDLSVKSTATATPPLSSNASEPEINIDVGVEDTCKPAPLDLTLEVKNIPNLPLTG